MRRGLSVADFLQALSNEDFVESFFETPEEKRLVESYLNGSCILCNIAPVIRVVLSKREKVLSFFGPEYKDWLNLITERRV